MDARQLKRLKEAVGTPPVGIVSESHRRVQDWFAQTAPLIQWDTIESPLGPLYIAMSERGLCSVSFGVSQADFLSGLDPLARTEQSPPALTLIAEQLQAYFAGARASFDLPLDLNQMTPFQRSVLQAARRIPSGTVWTYKQVAQVIDKPRASRAVGQALGRNPVPIVIPCHRVVASDGGLGGYSGGGGLDSKRLLLRLEGALLSSWPRPVAF
jgi:methylated-DNA-[protein]-cysteine S-methyltransferase